MTRPVLVIGLGGTGQWVLTFVKKNLLEANGGEMPPNVRLLAIDTVSRASHTIANMEDAGRKTGVAFGGVELDPGEFVSLGGYVYDLIRETAEGQYPHIDPWFQARDYLNKLPASAFNLAEGSEQLRQFGRLALFRDLASQSTSRVLNLLRAVFNEIRRRGVTREPVNIAIVSSFAGGTGAGMLIDMAYLVRTIAGEMAIENIFVQGYFVISTLTGISAPHKQMQARIFATWRELDRFMTSPIRPDGQKIKYHPSDRGLQISTSQRPYDVCYLLGADRAVNSLAALRPELGLYPSIADALCGFIFDSSRELDMYLLNLTGRLPELPNRPYYGSFGTYTFKIPTYYQGKESTYRLALDFLDALLKPITDEAGRVVRLSVLPDEEVSVEQALRNFLVASQVTFEQETVAIPPLLTQIAMIPSPQWKDEYVRWVDRFASAGKSTFEEWQRAILDVDEANEPRFIKREFQDEFRFSIASRFGLDQYKGETPEETVMHLGRQISQLIPEHYGRRLPDGTENRGRYGNALDEFSQLQRQRFQAVLRLWLLHTLMEEASDPALSQGGKLGFVDAFLNALIERLDQSLNFIRDVRVQRQENHLGQRVRRRSEKDFRAMVAASTRRWLGIFPNPRFRRTVQQYLRAVDREMDVRKDETLLDVMAELIQRMLDTSQQTRQAIDDWIATLATGNPAVGITSLYDEIWTRRDSIAAFRRADEQLDQVQRVLDIEPPHITNGETLEELLDEFVWDIRIETDRCMITCSLGSDPLHLAVKHRKATAQNAALLLSWAGRVSVTRPTPPNIITALRSQYQPDVLAEEVQGRITPLIAYASDAREPELLPHFILTPADQGKIDQEFLRSLAEGLHQYNLGKRPAHILSEYRDRCVFLRFDNLIPADDFALRHEYAKAYQTAIQNPRDAVNARLLHIFPAEINAVEIETTRWKQTGQIRLLHPSVVTLLEDRTKANLFALSLAYRFITLNTDDQGRVWFELANEAIYLTEPVQIRTDPVSLLPAAMYQFVIAGEDARPQRGQPIDYDRIHNAVWTIQREMDSQEAIDQLQQQLTTGVVAQLRGLSTDVTATERQLYTDMADVLEILLTGQIQARGEASRVERKPIVALDNFYVAGPPLRPGSGRLFAGRQDVFRKIEQLWRNPFQKQAVVLHGQRRMGKTSILYHLQEGLGTEYIPVMVDLQGQSVGWKAEADLWKTLSRRIERVLSRAGILSEPTDLASSPVSRQSFDVFLDSIEDVLGEQRYLVLMFDEFEMLERKIDAGIITVDFLDYLRHLIQHRRQILVVLAGHHTLEERMGKYWSPLMGVAQPIHVSYLDHRSAHQLITNPWDDFQLSYTQDAIARLEQATGRQPMLLQHACHIVINLVNERLKEIGGKLYPTATRADVDAALDRLTSRAFTYYFDAVWDWLDEEERDALVRLAQAAQKSPNGWVEYQDVRSVSQEVLERLVTREVLESRDDQCRFWIELLRQWVMKRDFETNV